MAIRLDPRRLSLLKELAGENGMRPGELVTQWIQERLDAERAGGQPTSAAAGTSAIAALSSRVDDLAQRLDELASQRDVTSRRERGTTSEAPPVAAVSSQPVAEQAASTTDTPAEAGRPAAAPPRRRRTATTASAGITAGARVPLHDEIASVISEGGPMSAAEIAQAIVDRGRYSAPRSDRPLDAATVNSRVSNPIYRSRFRREDGKIGLSD